jgi:hypothetical protein
MMCARFYGNAPAGTTFNLNFLNGTLIADQRSKLVEMSLKQGATHILFLDSDMRFPANLADRLIKHDKEIVACNYATRRMPVKTVAFKDFSTLSYMYSGDKTGLEECDAVGMGAMLVKAEVFGQISYPWFQIHYLPSARMWMGEDMYFCQAAKMAGKQIWIDHDLSKSIKHIGSFEFGHEHTEPMYEGDELAEAADKIKEMSDEG